MFLVPFPLYKSDRRNERIHTRSKHICVCIVCVSERNEEEEEIVVGVEGAVVVVVVVFGGGGWVAHSPCVV